MLPPNTRFQQWSWPLFAAAVLLGLLITAIFRRFSNSRKRKSDSAGTSATADGAIPCVRGGLPFLGHAVQLGTRTKEFLEDCHKEYGKVFQFKVLGKTFVFFDGSFKDAYFAASPHHLSFLEGIRRTLPLRHTIGVSVLENFWHAPLVKIQFSPKNVSNYFGTIQEQVKRVLEEEIGSVGSEVHENPERLAWKCIAACSAVSFLGKDLGQRDDILNVFIEFHKAVFKVIEAYAILPEWLLWLVATDVKKHKELVRKLVLPEIKRRQTLKAQDMPRDLLTAMIQFGRSPEDIAERMMTFIMASMITTAGVLAHVIFDMASPGRGLDPATKQALLEEQRQVVTKYGADVLTQEALNDMPRLKAFCWESMRTSAGPFQNTRYSMVDFEMVSDDKKDSIRVPGNAMLIMSGILIGKKELFFGKTANEFLPDRFLDKSTSKLIADEPSSLGVFPFGIGKHICPGRHFAMSEVMSCISTILRQYDMETVSGMVPAYKATPVITLRVVEPIRFVPKQGQRKTQ